MSYKPGRHFLQIPGPTNVPDRVLRAMDMPTIDHRGPEFKALAESALKRIRTVFGTTNPVVIYPASGTGAWEAALANTMNAGDRVLMYETGHFAMLWKRLAERLGLVPEVISGDWRSGVDPAAIEARLHEDKGHEIKAVCVVHNETSTGCASRIDEVRKAIDAANHPALILVDTISSLGSIDYRHDEWGVDVTVGGSQKGLMLPPGLSFNAVSDKALATAREAKMPRSFWDWSEMIEANEKGVFPFTPATNLLYGLNEALTMLEEEGLPTVYARHARHAEATRAAVTHWGGNGGVEVLCQNPRHFSGSLTAVKLPEGYDADDYRKVVLENFNMSLGNGLSKLSGTVFRIGHLGDFNDLMLMGTLSGVEMGFELTGIPYRKGGVQAAMEVLTASAKDTS